MCGESNRPVLGGTIAILKSLGESTLPDLSLLFHQDSTSTTRATFQSSLPAASDLDSYIAAKMEIYEQKHPRHRYYMLSHWR
ncbi:hypothetical protein D6C92_10332 [Aureobasidium pullulans]|nr:hypothetical protein D6C92_10332 [Aureobasidium pullulans]